jgi:hypothetical protein
LGNEAKRPKWVWVIFIWFIFAGISGLYKFYTISSGAMELPEGIVRPSGAFYYIKAIGTLVLFMVAALLLFIRKEIAKWFFSGLLAYTVISGTITLMSMNIPEQYKTMTITMNFITWAIYGLITWYSFKLKDKGYYLPTST